VVRVAVVADRPVPPWTARQLILAFEDLGVNATYLRPSDIVSIFGRGDSRVVYSSTLNDIDLNAVLLRDIGFTSTIETLLRRINVFEHIEMLGIPVINPIRAFLKARDKYFSLLLLDKAGIPVPRTAVVENYSAALKVAEQWKDVVLKPLIGSMGFGAIRATSVDIVYITSRTLNQLDQPIYIQEYIDKPNRDIRVFVVGNDIIAAYYRVQPTAELWKTNIAQGAKAVPIERIDEDLADIALRATKILGLHYAGVDIAESKDGYVVLEVNASPNWRGLARATGINPATHIARYVLTLLKK